MVKKGKSKEKIKKGVKAYESGKQFEDRVAKWLTKQGYTCSTRIDARGYLSTKPYEVDIYATKGLIFKHHIWVECKVHTIKRSHVTKLVEFARDVKQLHEEHSDMQKWSPNMLMVVSKKGFDIDAIKLADKYKIYCVKAGRTYQFVGKRNRDELQNGEYSEFD